MQKIHGMNILFVGKSSLKKKKKVTTKGKTRSNNKMSSSPRCSFLGKDLTLQYIPSETEMKKVIMVIASKWYF